MKTITDSVRTLLLQDETAREAARRGILNSSAYAREITPTVADQAWKEVEPQTVAVSVNRVVHNETIDPLKPELIFDRISVDSDLVDVTYERTQEMQAALASVLPGLRSAFENDLYLETNGQRQITMVMTTAMWQNLRSQIATKPIGLYERLTAISLSFDQKYLEVPNFIYGVFGLFAIKHINIIEIFSTMTEIVVVIDESTLEEALALIHPFLKHQ